MVLDIGEHSIVIKTHKQIKPKRILTVFTLTIISLGLFLTEISSDNLPKSFGQITNPIENQTLSIIPTQFGIPPELSASQKMLQQQAHVHSHLPQLDCMELHNRSKVLILLMECLTALTSDQILPKVQ